MHLGDKAGWRGGEGRVATGMGNDWRTLRLAPCMFASSKFVLIIVVPWTCHVELMRTCSYAMRHHTLS